MNEYKRQYSERIEQEEVPRYKTKSLDRLLPEWIINLQNYFEKGTVKDYSPTLS